MKLLGLWKRYTTFTLHIFESLYVMLPTAALYTKLIIKTKKKKLTFRNSVQNTLLQCGYPTTSRQPETYTVNGTGTTCTFDMKGENLSGRFDILRWCRLLKRICNYTYICEICECFTKQWAAKYAGTYKIKIHRKLLNKKSAQMLTITLCKYNTAY